MVDNGCSIRFGGISFLWKMHNIYVDKTKKLAKMCPLEIMIIIYSRQPRWKDYKNIVIRENNDLLFVFFTRSFMQLNIESTILGYHLKCVQS